MACSLCNEAPEILPVGGNETCGICKEDACVTDSCVEPTKCNPAPTVIEINNDAEPVLFYRTDIPASMGDDTTFPPKNGAYRNMLVVYEANNHAYLYNSAGIPTRLRGENDFNELNNRPRYAGQVMTGATNIPDIGTMREDINNEVDARTAADTALSNSITAETTARESADTTLTNNLTAETNARTNADNTLTAAVAQKANTADLSTVATTGAYADLTGAPTNLSSFTNDSGFQNASQVATSINAATDPINTAINQNVITDFTIDSTYSTSAVVLEKSKRNLYSGTTSTASLSLPVANASIAGIINPSIYNTIQTNATNINAILNGSVSIAGLPTNPTQAELTTAWQTATSISTVINGAKINDSDNQKVWTYYTNTSLWYAATNTAQVVVNQWTNSAAGIVKGSTGAGQIFAESDGTGSVNGWDALNDAVTANTGNISTIMGDYIKSTDLATVATSGSYNDLSDKPTVPVITVTNTDPGEGASLAANNFIFVYQ